MVEKDELKAEFSARLNEICDDMRVPPKGKNRQWLVGKQFGVSQEAARKWLEAESIPVMTTVIAMAAWAKVSTEWLLSGRGPKTIPANANAQIAEVNKLMEPMTDARKYDVVRIVKAIGQEPTPEERSEQVEKNNEKHDQQH